MTVPVLADAMSFTNTGSWNSTAFGAGPPRVNVTERSPPVIFTESRAPFAPGKFVTSIGLPDAIQSFGMPRPTISVPSADCAAIESSRTMFAFAMPHACGDDPCPVAGWLPVHGVVADGADELSHHEYGPLWLLAIMNS